MAHSQENELDATTNAFSAISLNDHDDMDDFSDDMTKSFLSIEMSVNFGKYLFDQFETFCHQINGYNNCQQEPFWDNIMKPEYGFAIKKSVEIFTRFQMKTFFYHSSNNMVRINSVKKDNDNTHNKVNIFSKMKRIEYYIGDLLNLCELEYQFQILITLALQQFEYVKSVQVEYGPVIRPNITDYGRIDVFYKDFANYGYVVELKLIKQNDVCWDCNHYGMLSKKGREKFEKFGKKYMKVDEILSDAFFQAHSYKKQNRNGWGAILLIAPNTMKSIGVIDKILYINNQPLYPYDIQIYCIKKWLKQIFGDKWSLYYINFFIATWHYCHQHETFHCLKLI